jgi:tetratricopeptide (TPR) repeat protein
VKSTPRATCSNILRIMRSVVVMALILVMVPVMVPVMSWGPFAIASSPDGTSTEKSAARSEWRQGNVAYDLAQYEEAAKHYEAAYTHVQDPVFLFNIGQSYRMGGKLDQALDRYRAFLRNTGEDTPNRDLAEKFIAEIKRKLEANKESTSIPATPVPQRPAPTPAPTPLAATPSSDIPPPAAAIAAPLQPLPESGPNLTSALATPEEAGGDQSRYYKKWWFWTGIGAAVAAGTVTALVLTHGSASPCSGAGAPCLEVK